MVETVEQPDVPVFRKDSREEEAELSLKRTRVTKGVAWTVSLMFLVITASEAIVQSSLGRGAGRALRNSLRLLPGPHWAESVEAQTGVTLAGPRRLWATLTPASAISNFEKELERDSIVGQWLRPRVQAGLTSVLGVGNEQAYVGRSGWLFYRPEIEHLTLPGFLEPRQLERRSRAGGPAVQADPVAALVRFREDLARRGIALVVFPAPMKPAVHPEKLSRRYDDQEPPLQNPSYRSFLALLEENGVAVFEASGLLADARMVEGVPQFLRTDSHWTPDAMERTARALAQFLGARRLLEGRVAPAGYKRSEATLDGLGDIASMFGLPDPRRYWKPETVTIHPVATSAGASWEPDRDAEVLVLGDSFSNIYSLAGMGWGRGAGFVEQLSYELQRPVDRIVLNAGGSFASREELARDLIVARRTRSKDRLIGKRVVVYQFAMRDLSFGDWKIIPLDFERSSP